jgi:hypothetical protein
MTTFIIKVVNNAANTDHLCSSVKSVVNSVSLPVRHLVSHSFATAEALVAADVFSETLWKIRANFPRTNPFLNRLQQTRHQLLNTCYPKIIILKANPISDLIRQQKQLGTLRDGADHRLSGEVRSAGSTVEM